MQSKHASLIFILAVASVHLGGLAAVVLWPATPAPVEVILPTIQGTLVMAQPEAAPPPPPEPPPPDIKPQPKPTPKPPPKPLPKAAPSERAVQAPEPEAPPILTPAEPVPAAPAVAQPAEPAPVTPPRADAGQLSNPAPAYPSMSRRLREEGTVLLEILIKADGTVGEVKLKQPSGFKRLDEIAMRTVARWRYQAATQAGKTIDFWYELPIEFNLH